ncbi:MAG: arsenate reductase ArsC [Anaerolineales bacterium]|nr:arsenate reductase ArsC [Anaerolineales bacterium]
MSTKQVLFLCTGNSCRSQMAEGLVNYFLSDQWKAYSAGTKPAGYVHPMAIQVMAEFDIDLSRNHSKSVEEFRHVSPDLVITVCDDAAEDCPVWLGQGHKAHLSFPDPAKATGTLEEQLVVFRTVRDDIRQRVFDYLATVQLTGSSKAV